MPKFGNTSTIKLNTVHPDLQKVLNKAIEFIDFAITEGYRDQATQDKYFAEGKSKLKFPNGEHNKMPSNAVDIVPYINGKPSYKEKDCVYYAGFIIGIAESMNIKLRWGGNWDEDGEIISDQTFQDLVHFELARK